MRRQAIATWVFATWLGITATAAVGACDFASHAYRDALADPAQITGIDVEIKKSRKWFKNSISILASNKHNIDDRFKDRLGADLTVSYRFGTCTFRADVRQNGDWKDHIKLLPGGNIVSSLDVRLREGNVLNAVGFKLLLPHTRMGVNEVLGALMLRDLGYIAPETFLVDTAINGTPHVMLFQENAEKELLERNLRREGPIFEGDESLLWNIEGFQPFALENIALARQTNDKWAAKGATSTQISFAAFQRLQAAYLTFADSVKQVGMAGMLLEPHSGAERHQFADYGVLLIAMKGAHGLRSHNRKFYFNSFTQSFEPIYYDGNLSFLGEQHPRIAAGAARETPFFLAHASHEAIGHLIRQIDALQTDATFKEAFLARSGPDREAAEALFEPALHETLTRLRALHAQMQDGQSPATAKTSDPIGTLQDRLLDRTRGYGVETDFVHVSPDETAGMYRAEWISGPHQAENFALSSEDLIRIMGKNSYDGRRVVLLPKPSGFDAPDARTMPFLQGHMVLSDGAKVEIDDDARQIVISQTTPTDWVLIRGVTLKDWDIRFAGAPQDPALGGGQRFNEFGLTGCLNFFDVDFDNSHVSGRDGQCEDTINIVSSRGTLRTLKVENGYADAIDIDFATVEIKDLTVMGTGNDCFDVSTGHFTIKEARLSDCGDKGISVGERSQLSAESVTITNAAIGISSKDLSQTRIAEFIGQNIPVCAEAFQKKQEFGGGALWVAAYECNGEVINDAQSNIELGAVIQ